MRELDPAEQASEGSAGNNIATTVPEGIVNELRSHYDRSLVHVDPSRDSDSLNASNIFPGCGAKPSDIDSKHSDGNERKWTDEEMAKAKPMPLPVLELDENGKLQRKHENGQKGENLSEPHLGMIVYPEKSGMPGDPEKSAGMAADRKEGQEGWPILNHYWLSDEQRKTIDDYLKTKGLNEYGDPLGTQYPGASPLFDEMTGRTRNRYDYLLDKMHIDGIDVSKLIRAQS